MQPSVKKDRDQDMLSLEGKRLLIQGAGRGHLGLIKTAKRNGIYTIITGMPGNYPCISLADKVCYADITDKERILQIAKEESVDGILICCSDTGLETVGYVCDQLDLPGISEYSAKMCSNKLLMKQALVDNNVRTAKFIKVHNKTDLQTAITSLQFPVIIKATDLQGSRGIYVVRCKKDLLMYYEHVMEQTKQSYCIIEEFIEGNEFGAQAFVYNGDILFVLPHGDETMMCGTAVPIGHYMPLNIDADMRKDIERQAQLAIKALKLDNCAVNIDLIEKDGKAYIIELTGRVGANCLPELTGNYWNIDYYEMILAVALGGNPKELFESRPNNTSATYAQMIKSEHAGVVKDILYAEPTSDMMVDFFISKGSEIRVFTNCNDAIGQIICIGKTLAECRDRINSFLNHIQISLR